MKIYHNYKSVFALVVKGAKTFWVESTQTDVLNRNKITICKKNESSWFSDCNKKVSQSNCQLLSKKPEIGGQQSILRRSVCHEIFDAYKEWD